MTTRRKTRVRIRGAAIIGSVMVAVLAAWGLGPSGGGWFYAGFVFGIIVGVFAGNET